MSTYDNLIEAYEQELVAMKNYKKWAEEAQDPSIKEMFLQFSKNESWHAAALREKIELFENEKRKE